jgi:hypothetical protein
LNEVDLNAPEAEPEPETKEVEVDLNAPEETKASKPSTPALLDVSELESNLGITSEAEPKKKSKIKMKPSKVETKAESKSESKEKSKPRTKKTKPVVQETVLGTKFG